MREFPGARIAIVSVLLAVVWSPCLAQVAPNPQGEPASPNAALTKIGMDKEIWIAARTDGQAGTGTASDPLDGSTQEKFDRIFIGLNKAKVTNITIHLAAGTFGTLGFADWRNPQDLFDPCTGWHMDAGWKLVGSGMGNTTLKLAGYTNEFRFAGYVTIQDGVWKITSTDYRFKNPDFDQAIRLVRGKNLKGLEIGKVYYVCEVLDAWRFKVSATPGGPPLTDIAIGSDGAFYRIVKVRRGWDDKTSSVIKGEGADIEVRDLTVDLNWPSFGGLVTEDFKMPADLQTVTVAVDSVDWAKPLVQAWVYLVTPLKVHKNVGHFELVRVVDDRHVELRNMHNFKTCSGETFLDDATRNVTPGTVVAKGTRVGPEMLTIGVLVEGDRATVQRVRITNQTGTLYEGGCSIGIGSWGGKPYHGMAIRDCITDNMWGGMTSGIHILSRAIFASLRSKTGEGITGAQGVLEGNTILANGVAHSGLSVGGAINTVVRNNKVVNAGTGLYSEGPIRNIVIRDNQFLECPPDGGAMTVNSAWLVEWRKDDTYKAGDYVLWNGDEYQAKADNAGKEPSAEQFWQAYPPWVSKVIVEHNMVEVCERSSGIAFYGASKDVVIRDNVIDYAPGCDKGSISLAVSGYANRGFLITGNIVDSRLRIDAGASSLGRKAAVFSKDNVDELGRPRGELDMGQTANAQTAQRLPANLGAILPADDPKPAEKPIQPLITELGPMCEIQDWLILGPFPHPLGAGYTFDFLSKLGGEANAKPRTGDSMLVKFPDGPDARTIWKESQLKPGRIAWQRVKAQHYPGSGKAYKEWVDLRPLLGTGEDTDNTCVYAACILRAEKTTPIRLRLGSDDGNVVYLNGKKIGQAIDDRRTYVLDSDVHEAVLKAGDNLVVIKICNATGGFNFGARVTSAATDDLAVPGGAVPKGVKVVLP